MRLGRVAVATEEAEAGPVQLLEQAEPVAHHGRVVAGHLEARPVEVDLQQQLAHLVQDALQDQVLQDLPLGALHVRLQHVQLSGGGREGGRGRERERERERECEREGERGRERELVEYRSWERTSLAVDQCQENPSASESRMPKLKTKIQSTVEKEIVADSSIFDASTACVAFTEHSAVTADSFSNEQHFQIKSGILASKVIKHTRETCRSPPSV